MKLLIISLLAVLTHSCIGMNQVEFKPVFQIDEKLVEKEPTEGFYSRLQYVLKFHNEDYSVDEDGIIYINRSLRRDKDLCWNYTTKANDSKWLSEH